MLTTTTAERSKNNDRKKKEKIRREWEGGWEGGGIGIEKRAKGRQETGGRGQLGHFKVKQASPSTVTQPNANPGLFVQTRPAIPNGGHMRLRIHLGGGKNRKILRNPLKAKLIPTGLHRMPQGARPRRPIEESG
jgi:hypothetical protein